MPSPSAPVLPHAVAPSSTELASIHTQLVRVLGRRACPDAASAPEDVAQTTWIRLLERLQEFEGRSSLRTFAFGIATNVQRELTGTALRRRRLLTAHVDMTSDEPEREPERVIDRERARLRLRRAMDTLEGRERWLVEMRIVEELPYESILPAFQQRFPNHITTVEGLRSAFFRARARLVAQTATTLS